MAKDLSVIKSTIDAQVGNKTAPYSISHSEVAQIMKDLADLSLPLQFSTTDSRLAYLQNPACKPFQFADDLQDGNKYYVNKDGNDWVGIVTAYSGSKTEVLLFTNLLKYTILWTSDRRLRFGDGGNFIVELIDEDGIIRQKPNLEIKPNSLSDTTSYEIDFGGGERTGRIIIK